MINTNIEAFFKHLAERKYHENDLSDITYALCQSNENFRNFFLKFLFEKNIYTNDLAREFSRNKSRPDFFFHDDKETEYLIEVKIFDKNLHDEYSKSFPPPTEKAFIANYQTPPRKDWKHPKEWKKFYKCLKESELANDCIISGYLSYLGKTIEIKEFKKMILSDYTGLPKLFQNLECVAQELSLDLCNISSFDINHYGRYFTKNKLFFWIGVNLEKNALCIGFVDHPNWTPSNIQNKIKNNKKFKKNNCELGDYWFEDTQVYKKLCDEKKTKEDQEILLKTFINSVFKSIEAQDYLI